jgi:prepilin-type N-terminal cleavage/methylation domain-containing protein
MNKAFTLIELAIVIVVIGILVSGVVAGQSIIESSKIRSLTTDIEKYRMAVNAYSLEFDALPGDHDEAWDYWGTDCAATEGACNGDDNNQIGRKGLTTQESVMFWKHLELSGILNQSFELSGLSIIPGQTCPAMKYESKRSGIMCPITYPNYYGFEGSFVMRSNSGGASEWPSNSYKIDKKIDDGMPYRGIMKGYGNGCIKLNIRPEEYANFRGPSTPGYYCSWFFHLYGRNSVHAP